MFFFQVQPSMYKLISNLLKIIKERKNSKTKDQNKEKLYGQSQIC